MKDRWSKLLGTVNDNELHEIEADAGMPSMDKNPGESHNAMPNEADLEKSDPVVELEGWLDASNENIWAKKGLKMSDFYPPSTVEMRGNVYHIPNAAGWMLDTHYGNWHVVEKCKHAPDGHCP